MSAMFSSPVMILGGAPHRDPLDGFFGMFAPEPFYYVASPHCGASRCGSAYEMGDPFAMHELRQKALSRDTNHCRARQARFRTEPEAKTPRKITKRVTVDPKVSVSYSNKEITITTTLQGIKPENLSLDFDASRNEILLSGTVVYTSNPNQRNEIVETIAEFNKTVELGQFLTGRQYIDENSISASLEGPKLTVKLQKITPMRRKIAVEAGGSQTGSLSARKASVDLKEKPEVPVEPEETPRRIKRVRSPMIENITQDSESILEFGA